MDFHIEERRAWVRSGTHTIVFDRDPDYARFAVDTSGTVRRMLRVWLAQQRDGQTPKLRAYLGTIGYCAGRPSLAELRKLFRRASHSAAVIGQPGPAVVRALARTLREYRVIESPSPAHG